MTMLDNLTSEMGSRFNIGSAAEPLMREFLQLMTGGPGGLGGFLDRFRNAGMSNEVSSFLDGKNQEPLPAKAVDKVLGDATVVGISRRVGLAPAVVSTAAGFEIPKLIGMLTPGGRLPSALPSDVQSFVRTHDAEVVTGVPREAEQVSPMATAVIRDQGRRSPWPWVILGLVLLGLLLGALLVRRPQVAAPAPVAVVAPTVHAPAIPA